MQLFLHRPIDLSYCTNVHPGETWNETFANLKNFTVRIRDRVAPGERFGIGLRLSELACRELEMDGNLDRLKEFLARENMYVFTLNAFPYGQFHATKIKENVFAPDWTQAARFDYTRRCTSLLARLLPAGMEGSLSTVPGSFREWITQPEQTDAMIKNLAECAYHMEDVSASSGHHLHLGLEPEPMGYLEKISDLADFFETGLLRKGVEHLRRERGITADESASILGRRIGMCYDTCHMALQYEEPESCLDQLRDAGIFISKFQISSALRCKPTPAARNELQRFADGVYLHQVIARARDGNLRQWKDIAPAIADWDEAAQAEELRVHCHVPLDWEPTGALGSTADHIEGLLRALKDRNETAHFEIETYTWDVLPDELKQGDITRAVAGEFRWFMDRLAGLEERIPTKTA